MLKTVRVNSLAVAKRWQKTMQDSRHPLHHKKIGIWPRETQGRAEYSYNNSTMYIVGNQTAVHNRYRDLGERIA
jgi:hypothetical protein